MIKHNSDLYKKKQNKPNLQEGGLSMKKLKKLSRKEFLYTVGLAGTTILIGNKLLKSSKELEAVQPKCDDVSGLKKEEIEQRKALKYTDNSPEKGKLCSNCALYVPAKPGSQCGGCTLIKGPISPNGWCTSWIPKG